MKDLSNKIKDLLSYIDRNQITSVSLDIDGTLYPMRKVEVRWWQIFMTSPFRACRFIAIRKRWEKRRKGSAGEIINPEDVVFFEEFLLNLLSPDLIPPNILEFMQELSKKNVSIFFLSDHGTDVKLRALGIGSNGVGVNCLNETGELKPHAKISDLLIRKYHINPVHHLHLGDRWTDEEQAQLIGAHFQYLAP